MVWVCFILMICILLVNYKLSKDDIFSPNMVFVFAFTCALGICCVANLIIGIDFESELTLLVVVGGALIFTIIKWMDNLFVVDKIGINMDEEGVSNKQFESLRINSCWYVISLWIVLLATYFDYHYILDFGRAYGAADFIDSMVLYKVITTLYASDDKLVTPTWYCTLLLMISCPVSYISMFVAIRNKVLERKVMWLPITTSIIYFIQSLMSGGRTEAFRIITALLFMWYIFYKYKYGSQKGNTKAVRVIFSVLGMVSALFFVFVVIIGRTTRDISWDDLFASCFVYAGAPLFNLDYFLVNPWPQTFGIWGELTFRNFIRFIGRKLSISNYNYENDLPFLSYQNFDMGNVFTTYYAFYYDFQLFGVVALTIIMALICMYIYALVQRQNIGAGKINVCVICYAFLVNDVFMSIFAHRFYETITEIGAYYRLVILLIIVRMFEYVFSKKGIL